jgi:enoyl-CoA hydratase/carnithine racemase
MTDQVVTLSTGGRVARLTLDRPESGNLITSTMMRQLAAALTEAGDAGADILVISANGPDFSLGRDQHEVLPDGVTRDDNTRLIVTANDALADFPGVTISSVRGRAVGFGCGLALQTDFTVVADTALLGFDETRHGLSPKFVMGYLESFVGRKRAVDLILTGRLVPAAEAERIGMVSRVVPEDDLAAATEALVATLSTSPGELLLRSKRYLHAIRDVHPDKRMKHALDRMLSKP